MSTIFDFDTVSFSTAEIGFPAESGAYPSFLRGFKVTGSGSDMVINLYVGMDKNMSTPIRISMDKVAWLLASFLRACGISVSGQVDVAKELENIQNTPIFFRVQYTAGTRDENDSWVNWPRYKFYRATESDISIVDQLKLSENGDAHLTDEEAPF
tara:strand:+ start:11079 stop:11543 length:465 start_codon:yes stop_codon:yes gene_type:complete